MTRPVGQITKSVTMLAGEDFRKGEIGYAIATGVWKLSGADVPDGAILVRADQDVLEGEHGRFAEVKRPRLSLN